MFVQIHLPKPFMRKRRRSQSLATSGECGPLLNVTTRVKFCSVTGRSQTKTNESLGDLSLVLGRVDARMRMSIGSRTNPKARDLYVVYWKDTKSFALQYQHDLDETNITDGDNRANALLNFGKLCNLTHREVAVTLSKYINTKETFSQQYAKIEARWLDKTWPNDMAPIYILDSSSSAPDFSHLEFLIEPCLSDSLNSALSSASAEKPMLRRCPCGPDGDCMSSSTCPCARFSEQNSFYEVDEKGILTGVPSGRAGGCEARLFECGDQCWCGEKCTRRTVQRGRQFPVILAKLRKAGWGLYAVTAIPMGSLVTELVGEMITKWEARKRVDRKYFMHVEEHAGIEYIIDCKTKGNEGRFINHSCSPNLRIVSMQNPTFGCLQRISFFSRRKILPGEELTFSYVSEYNQGHSRNSSLKCQCGAKDCVGLLPTN